MEGVIRSLRGSFGYVRSSNGTDFFFHQTACKDGTFLDLEVGDRVTFDAEPAFNRAPNRAQHVRRHGKDAA